MALSSGQPPIAQLISYNRFDVQQKLGIYVRGFWPQAYAQLYFANTIHLERHIITHAKRNIQELDRWLF